MIAAVISAAYLAMGASAQTPIAVETTVFSIPPVVSTTHYVGGADIPLSLTLTANTLVRIYDTDANGGALTASVGKITIDGTNPSNYLLNVLVASEATLAFPTNPGLPIANGVINLGGTGTGAGIKVYNSSNAGDTSLRDRTRVAIGVSGDITGTIHVAEIFRVQADDDILAALTATGTLASTTGFDAVTRVVAGDSITGAITVSHGNIDRISVGPSTSATGISGDITANTTTGGLNTGLIKSIFSTGPIGNGTSTPMRIVAGRGIGQIRTAVDDTGTLLDRDVEAEIVSHQYILDNLSTFTFANPTTDGPLELLEVGGDLDGSVHAANIACDQGACPKTGIFVNGICWAPITVDLTVFESNIVARTFVGDISIGRMLLGTVVATGGATTPNIELYPDGTIPSIEVGRNILAAAEGTYSLYGIGLVSGQWDRLFPTTDDHWLAGGDAYNSIDSVIHAEYQIGEASLKAMQGRFHESISPVGWKHPPAVEAPYIDELTIDYFSYGVVWGGQHHPSAIDPDEWYTVIGTLNIGCMRQITSVWMKDWGVADVEGDMFGDFHLAEIPSDKTLRIGGKLGHEESLVYADPPDREASGACACNALHPTVCDEFDIVWNYFGPGNPNPDLYFPRNPDWPYCDSARDERGQVIVHAADELAGQVIINAQNTSATNAQLWTGVVGFDDDLDGCFELEISSTPSSAEWEAPYYEGLPGDLGGGAVGLVEYHLHDEACTPPNDSTVCAIEPLEANDDKETAILTHYGPLLDALPNNSTVPYIITRQSFIAVCDPSCHLPDPEDVSHLFKVTLVPDGAKRDLWLYPKTIGEGGEGTFGNWCEYTVELRETTTGHTDLRSDETFASVPPDIAGYPYTVTLFCFDMNLSGGLEPGDISAWIDQPVDCDGDFAADATDLGLVIDAVANAP